MGDHAARRLTGFDYIGLHRYSLTICTFRRRRWFEDPSAVASARTQLLTTMKNEAFGITAYCFMPDHVHLILEGQTESSDLKPAMHRWKQTTGYNHRRQHHVRLWQTGYYDHVLREDADLLAAAAYIIGNPLRAGLVSSVCEYPHSGSSCYSLEQLADAIQSGRSCKDG